MRAPGARRRASAQGGARIEEPRWKLRRRCDAAGSSPRCAAEFRGLAARAARRSTAQSGRSPPGVKERLRLSLRRIHGARALEPAPRADRLRLPHLLPPDRHRPGGVPAAGRGRDARAAARGPLQEPRHARRRAHGRDRRDGRRGAGVRRRPDPGRARAAPRRSRRSGSGGDGLELPDGTIVLADERHAVGPDLRRHRARARRVAPTRGGSLLCAVQVPGVPDISVEEALWICSDILDELLTAGPGWAPGPLVDFSPTLRVERNSCLSCCRATSQTAREHTRPRCCARDVDEAAARRSLRDQIARLERELAALFTSAYPRPGPRLAACARPAARGCSASASSRSCATSSPARLEDTRRTLRDRGYVETAQPRADRGDDRRARSASSGCASPTTTSGSPAASTGTPARGSA